MEPVLEGCDDPEVAAAAAQAPEQVGVLALARGQEAAVGGDDVRRDQVVAGKAVLALEPADAAAERQTRDAGARDGAAGGREAERLRLAVELAPRQARLRAHGARVGSTRMGPAGSGPLRHASCRCVPMYTAPAGPLGRLDVVFIAAAP